MAHWLFLPDDAMDDIATLADLSAAQFEALRQLLEAEEGGRSYDLYLKIAESLGIPDQKAAGLYTLFDYVQDERSRNEQNGTAVVQEFERFLQSRVRRGGSEGAEAEGLLVKIRERSKPLAALLGVLPRWDLAKKIHHLKSGPLPHLHTFRLYCDLRPVFDGEGEKIVGWIPTVTLRMVVHATQDRPKEVVVQLSEEDQKSIRKQLDRLDKKLAALKSRFESDLHMF